MVDGRALTIVATEPAGPIAQFRDMHRRLLDGQPLTPSQVDILVEGFGSYLDAVDAGERTSLDRSFGLKRWGGLSSTRSQLLERRDMLILRLWKSSPDFCQLPPFAASGMMCLSADQYQRRRWPREKRAIAAPPSEPAATWWHILKSGVPIPGIRRVYQILSDHLTADMKTISKD